MKFLKLLSVILVCGGFFKTSFAETLSTERLIFRTNCGDLVVALYPSVAPQHTAQIIKLANLGLYDNADIYRIEKGLFAQIENFDFHGTALTPDQLAAVKKLPAEFSSIHHRRGLLSMARYDDINSAETSFSFMLGDVPHLDNQYTVFGEVTDGLEVLAAIEKVPTDDKKAPLVPVRVLKVDVVKDSDLAQITLAKAHAPSSPVEAGKLYFLIFATTAFVGALGSAIIKIWREPTPAPAKKS